MPDSMWCREHLIEVGYVKRDPTLRDRQMGYITRRDFLDLYGVDPYTGEEP